MTVREFHLIVEEVYAAALTGNNNRKQSQFCSDSEDLVNCSSIPVSLSFLTVYALVLFDFTAMPGCPVKHGLLCK